jgi:chromosome segregation ATPase
VSEDDLRKRAERAEQAAADARERAAAAGRALLDAEARAAADRAAAALAEDALVEGARREQELQDEIARLEQLVEQHRQWLVSIQSSTSWKITKPLRSLSR